MTCFLAGVVVLEHKADVAAAAVHVARLLHAVLLPESGDDREGGGERELSVRAGHADVQLEQTDALQAPMGAAALLCARGNDRCDAVPLHIMPVVPACLSCLSCLSCLAGWLAGWLPACHGCVNASCKGSPWQFWESQSLDSGLIVRMY
jgi:hypothetical protein